MCIIHGMVRKPGPWIGDAISPHLLFNVAKPLPPFSSNSPMLES